MGDAASADVDFEDAMMSPKESDKQVEEDKQKTDESQGYGKVYTMMHEKRAERSLSRAEKREQYEKRKKEEAARKAAQMKADKCAQEEVKQVIERAQLEEEEMAVQKKIDRKRKLQDQADEEQVTQSGSGKVSATSKQQWKEHLGLKAKKHRQETEEEYQEVDDEEKDLDYQPIKGP